MIEDKMFPSPENGVSFKPIGLPLAAICAKFPSPENGVSFKLKLSIFRIVCFYIFF